MGHTFAVGVAVVMVSFLTAVGMVAPVVSAETSQPEPAMTLVGANVTVDAGETRLVDATYRLRVAHPDSDFESVTTIEGTMWRFTGRDVRDLTVSVDGTEMRPDVSRNAHHLEVSVPVPQSAREETVVVRFRYRVSGPAGRLRLPLWVPSANPPGDDRVVGVTVRLPDETRIQSATFPAVEPREDDASVLSTQLTQMPGLMSLEYGQESPILTLDEAVSLAGIGTLAGLSALWIASRGREGPDVD
jgi:hypothetical protein